MATKNGPFCAEEIQEEAIVCKHRGRDLEPAEKKEEKTEGLQVQQGTLAASPVDDLNSILQSDALQAIEELVRKGKRFQRDS